MPADEPRPPAAADLPALLALNNAHATELSPLDAGSLDRLLAGAFFARVIGGVDAFVVAFEESAAYESPNFQWFRTMRKRFVYIDRVCVAPHARGRGMARRLYAGVAGAARAAHRPLLCCEVNAVPPNPVSDAFHARLGFAQSGSGEAPGGKSVRYLELDLREASWLREQPGPDT